MNSNECSFTIHHWPALQEWDVRPHEFAGRGMSFFRQESGAPTLLEAMDHCLQLAKGKPTAIIIESGSERYELRLQSA